MRIGLVLLLTVCVSFLQANIKVIQHSERQIILEFELPEVRLQAVEWNGQNYYRLDVPQARLIARGGHPQLPYFTHKVAIPPGSRVQVRVLVLAEEEKRNVRVYPVVDFSGIREEVVAQPNDSIYRMPVPYPERVVEISEPYIYRKLPVVQLTVFPVQYIPADDRLRLLKRLRIVLDIQREEKSPLLRVPVRFRPAETELLEHKVVNFRQARQWAVAPGPALRKTTVSYDFSTGDWFKIPVTEEGIYRITGEFLKSRGVEISQIQTATIQMFNYGGAPLPYSVYEPRPDDLNEIAIQVVDNNGNGIMDEEDVILFYGRGVDGWKYNPRNYTWKSYHHPYATTNFYLLTYNQNIGKRIPIENSPNKPGAVKVQQFVDRYRFEEDRYIIISTGLDWFWVRLAGLSDQKSVDFQLPQNLLNEPVKFSIRFMGESGFRYGDNDPYSDTLDIVINGTKIIDNITIYRTQSRVTTENRATLSPFKPGKNTLTILHRGNLEGCRVLMDYFIVQVRRALVAENNFLKLNDIFDGQYRSYTISGFSGGGNRVWDVTDFANVREIVPLQNSTSVTFQDSAGSGEAREYYVFNPSVIQDVTTLERIPNRPNLRDPSRRGRLIVIVPEKFYEATEAFETYRETHPIYPVETERVILEDIYREFSSGVPDVTAIRDFLMWAYYNWSLPPEYVMLMGDGSYDYKGIEVSVENNHVPTFQISGSDEVSSRETDHFYVAFGWNGRNMRNIDPWLPIGRIPVNNVQEIEIFLEKQIRYVKSYLLDPEANGWQTIMTFVADDEIGTYTNEWEHLAQTENLIKRYVEPLKKFIVRKIYLTDYETEPGGLGRIKPGANEDLMNQINQGTLIINYIGHGDPATWAHEQVLVQSRDLPKFQNEDRLPFFVAATCDWGKYDDPKESSMAEEMIWLPMKGGIGVLASSRPVYSSSNARLASDFYNNLFTVPGKNRHSEIVGDALVRSLGGGENDQKFRYFGDPTLRLADPDFRIQITSISPDTLKALSKVTVTGRVIDTQGQPMTDFNGDAVMWVFDAEDTNVVDLAWQDIVYTYQGGTVFKGRMSVVNGELTANFIVPKSIKYKPSPTGRLYVYAWSETSGDAVGSAYRLMFHGTESNVVDREGPEIEFSFADQPNFFDGDYVSSQPRVIIRLYDENGINLTQEVGHRIELTIDDRIKKDVTSFFVYDKDSYQSGKLEYTLPPLPEGVHRMKISAWDNLNNYSEKEITFRTTRSTEMILDQVANYPNPFQEDTYFTFQFQSPNGSAEVTIKIYTITGRLIREITDVAYPGFNKIYWDGRDEVGDVLANGVYLYKIIVDDGDNRLEKIEKLAIVR
ncbi:MAG: type IX secretion system sortase PorU [Calditrichaeota bacterium]|nr:type IX secretion system sortase PorU [Calditrichota bacterium]